MLLARSVKRASKSVNNASVGNGKTLTKLKLQRQRCSKWHCRYSICLFSPMRRAQATVQHSTSRYKGCSLHAEQTGVANRYGTRFFIRLRCRLVNQKPIPVSRDTRGKNTVGSGQIGSPLTRSAKSVNCASVGR